MWCVQFLSVEILFFLTRSKVACGRGKGQDRAAHKVAEYLNQHRNIQCLGVFEFVQVVPCPPNYRYIKA